MRGCRYTAPPLTSTVSVVDRTPQLYYITNNTTAKVPFHNPIGAFRRKADYSDEQFDFYECKYFDRKITVKECRQEKAQLEKIRGIQVADMRFVCTDGFTFEDEHEFILIDGKTLYSSF